MSLSKHHHGDNAPPFRDSRFSEASSYRICDPAGREIRIPETLDEDRAYFTAEQALEAHAYFVENGYVVLRDIVPPGDCAAALGWFRREVRPSNRYIYRQTTAKPERHVLTPQGYMLNPILNVQSLDSRFFRNFRHSGLAIMTHPNVQRLLCALLGEPGKLVQSMFFEGNSKTWAHQDTYYLDAERPGGMAGAWFALEDIAPGAGRFFVYPGSHRLELSKNGGEIDIAFHHDRYKKRILELLDEAELECRAPALQRGDILFWSSKTVHGSLETRQPERSRSSFTAHYIPDSSRLLQFQSRYRGLNLQHVNGMRVHMPKDLDRPTRRSMFWIETSFPRTFTLTKKLAIKALTR